MSDELLVELTEEESTERKHLETIVTEIETLSYIYIGRCLRELSEKRLYKSTHRTFAAYVQETFGMSRQTAYQLINAAEVAEKIAKSLQNNGFSLPVIDRVGVEGNTQQKGFVLNCGQDQKQILPQRESQARELVGLSPEDQVNAWQMVLVALAEGEKLTAKLIKSKVSVLKALQPAINNKKSTARDETEVQALCGTPEIKDKENAVSVYEKNRRSEEIEAALVILTDLISTESNSGWRKTARAPLFGEIKALLDIIGHADKKELEQEGCSMELSDREKLIMAGFRIFRLVPKKLQIQEWRGGEWVYVQGFDTHSQMLPYFNTLMKDDKHLRG